MNSKAPLGISLLANAGLAVALVTVVARRPAPGPNEPGPAAPVRVAMTNAPAPHEEPAALSAASGTNAAKQFDWRMVESADYRKYIANLRAIGCPEETIRDIIVADVNKMFQARRKEITASTNKFLYWKGGNYLAGARDPARIEKLQALDQEKRDLLKELLGPAAPVEPSNFFANFNPYEGMMDFLSSEKQGQITDARAKYETKAMKLVADGRPDAEGMRKIQQMQKDFDADLQGIISPDEYRQYQLRMSDTAMSMRAQLRSFDPSQEEFDKIFDLRKKYDDDYRMLSLGEAAQEDRDKAKAARNAMNDQIQALLGDDRYTDYNRTMDGVFQTIYNVTDRYGLSKDVAVKVYDMRKSAQDAANNLRNDASLTEEQRDAALLTLRNDTQSAVVSTLGDKAWNTYRSQAGWLNKLNKKQ